VPLACGGPDAVPNMQWQTIAKARAKDTWERKACVRLGNFIRALGVLGSPAAGYTVLVAAAAARAPARA